MKQTSLFDAPARHTNPPAVRDQLARSCLSMVHHLARKHYFARKDGARLNCHDYDDMVGAGMVALERASRLFDADRGWKFTTLAFISIRRAVKCECDKIDSRRKREMQAFGDSRGHRESDVADVLADKPDHRHEAADRRLMTAEDAEGRRRVFRKLRETLRGRKAAWRVLRLRYLNGWSGARIAARLGVSKQRVRDILNAAMRELRRKGRKAVLA